MAQAPSRPTALRAPAWTLSPLLVLLGALLLGAWRWVPGRYTAFQQAQPSAAGILAGEGVDGLARVAALACLLLGSWCVLAAAAAWIRQGWALSVVRKSCLGVYLAAGLYGATVFQGTWLLQAHEVKFGGFEAGAVDVFFWRLAWLWPCLPLLGIAVFCHLHAWRAGIIAAYTGREPEEPAAGDRFFQNLRTHGPDPQYRKSAIWSVALHFFFIVILPWLLSLWAGRVEDYRVPKGSGQPVVALVQMVKPKPKKKKKYVLNPNSAILFNQPDLDDSEQFKKVEELSKVEYKAGEAAKAGKLGQGGGKTGGWPDGMENAKVRFIRLEYDGPDWNDGMDARSGADINFLADFNHRHGFKTATAGESHAIRLLKEYKPGYAPPFVYMTGSSQIRISRDDAKVLRQYLLDGGMLFADCGHPHWHRGFQGLMKQALPEYALVVISDDDPIFQQPYPFPNGAPPLWHHGGNQALGIKHEGRWIVFYHPGDINDAWKKWRERFESRADRRSVPHGQQHRSLRLHELPRADQAASRVGCVNHREQFSISAFCIPHWNHSHGATSPTGSGGSKRVVSTTGAPVLDDSLSPSAISTTCRAW
ncbi:MAG: DUF4159 domain-containing protein [Planctomycetota bacterium]|nr:DUF4159 domain-containing protein [Planctomycetota bacterium]